MTLPLPTYDREQSAETRQDLLRTAAWIEADLENLAACAPSICGSACWPEGGSHPTPDEDAVVAACQTLSVLEIAFADDWRGAWALAFYWFCCGARARGKSEEELGAHWLPTIRLWRSSHAAWARGRRAQRMDLVYIIEGCTRIRRARRPDPNGELVVVRNVRVAVRDVPEAIGA